MTITSKHTALLCSLASVAAFYLASIADDDIFTSLMALIGFAFLPHPLIELWHSLKPEKHYLNFKRGSNT